MTGYDSEKRAFYDVLRRMRSEEVNDDAALEFSAQVGIELNTKFSTLLVAAYFFLGYHSRDEVIDELREALRHIAEWYDIEGEDNTAAIKAFARDVLGEGE